MEWTRIEGRRAWQYFGKDFSNILHQLWTSIRNLGLGMWSGCKELKNTDEFRSAILVKFNLILELGKRRFKVNEVTRDEVSCCAKEGKVGGLHFQSNNDFCFFQCPHNLFLLKVQYSCVTPAPGIWDISVITIPTDYEKRWN